MARLLFVDDEVSLRRGLAGCLRLCGHEVLEAGGLEEAIDLAQKQPPEMVITDLRLEDGTGLDLARRLEAHELGTPILLISGYLESGVFRGGRPALIKAVLEKPVRPKELRAAIDRLLAEKVGPALRSGRAKEAISVESVQAMDRRRMRALLWGQEG